MWSATVERCDSSIPERCCKELYDRFEIQHTTIQFETEDRESNLASESRV